LTGSFPITPLDEWIGRKIGAGPGRLNRELLERHQVTKVNETLELAVDRSTHYRRILGCPAPRMRSLVDVESLPFTLRISCGTAASPSCACDRMKWIES
jgi:hypothetical protein